MKIIHYLHYYLVKFKSFQAQILPGTLTVAGAQVSFNQPIE
jgi:hypothetical protein